MFKRIRDGDIIAKQQYKEMYGGQYVDVDRLVEMIASGSPDDLEALLIEGDDDVFSLPSSVSISGHSLPGKINNSNY